MKSKLDVVPGSLLLGYHAHPLRHVLRHSMLGPHTLELALSLNMSGGNIVAQIPNLGLKGYTLSGPSVTLLILLQKQLFWNSYGRYVRRAADSLER